MPSVFTKEEVSTVERCICRGTEAYKLGNGCITVTVFKTGGKIASIQKGNTEYISQGHSSRFVIPEFEGNFGEYDLSGFDDMVPTVNAGLIQDGIFAGVHMADHGELWALDWDIQWESGRLKASADGVRLPYSLHKEISLSGNTVFIEYELRNRSTFPFPCLWAAHMLINANEHTRIIPGDDFSEIRVTLDMFSRLNGFGSLHTWPETLDKTGKPYGLNRLQDRNAGVCEKFYFNGLCKSGTVRIKNPDMCIRFDPLVVPYLGIWLNSSGYKEQYNIGIEPATAPMDSPENAKQWGYSAELPGKGSLRWRLEIEAEDS